MSDIGTYIICRQLVQGGRKKKFCNYVCTYFKLEYNGSGIKNGYTGKDRLLNRAFQVTLATRLPM